jgi:hypothetical protein
MTGSSAAGGIGVILYLAIIVFFIVTFWKVFEKAGRPGWAAIIPIYNVYIYCKVAGRPGWWILLFLIPIVNIVIGAIVAIDVAKHFSKSTAFGVGLWLLAFIFAPILAFGPATFSETI